MKALAAFLLAVALGYFASSSLVASAAPPPPRAGQPHPDQFSAAPYGNLAQYSPLYKKALLPAHTLSYALVTMPGCNTGSVPQAMQRVEAEASSLLRFALVRNDTSPDFTVRINCGSEQIRICGAVTIFCLGRGFPSDNDVELSDLLSTYTQESQLAIPEHEIIGHALAVWDEQYCKGTETSGPCNGLVQFASTPNWHDIMNTGPDSRHGLEAIELERWSRTMYDVLGCAAVVGYDSCTGRWFQADGWSWDPSTANWFNAQGQVEFLPCNGDHIRFDQPLGVFMPPGSGAFQPSRGFWAFSPPC